MGYNRCIYVYTSIYIHYIRAVKLTMVHHTRIWVAGILIYILLGCDKVWNNNLTYYIIFFGGGAGSGSSHNTSILLYGFTIMAAVRALSMPLGSKLALRWNPAGFTALVVVVFTGCIALSSFTMNVYVFALVYSASFGVCYGFLVLLPLRLLWKRYPERRGMVSGVIASANGSAGVVFNYISLLLVNPNGVRLLPSARGYFNSTVPYMLRVMAAMWLCMGLLASGLLANVKPTTDTCKTGVGSSADKVAVDTSIQDVLVTDALTSKTVTNIPTVEGQVFFGGKMYDMKNGYNVRQCICTRQFWALYVVVMCCVCYPSIIVSYYRIYGAWQYDQDWLLTVAGSFGALLNGVGRIVCGLAYDKLHFRTITISVCIIQIIQGITFALVIHIPFCFVLWTGVMFACYGCWIVVFVTAVQEVFGGFIGSTVYSILYSAYPVSALLGAQLNRYLLPVLGPSVFFTVLAILPVVSIAIVTCVPWRLDWETRNNHHNSFCKRSMRRNSTLDQTFTPG
jgi:MFS family permease